MKIDLSPLISLQKLTKLTMERLLQVSNSFYLTSLTSLLVFENYTTIPTLPSLPDSLTKLCMFIIIIVVNISSFLMLPFAVINVKENSGTIVEKLSRLTSLKELSLGNTKITEWAAALSSLTRLRTLVIFPTSSS